MSVPAPPDPGEPPGDRPRGPAAAVADVLVFVLRDGDALTPVNGADEPETPETFWQAMRRELDRLRYEARVRGPTSGHAPPAGANAPHDALDHVPRSTSARPEHYRLELRRRNGTPHHGISQSPSRPLGQIIVVIGTGPGGTEMAKALASATQDLGHTTLTAESPVDGGTLLGATVCQLLASHRDNGLIDRPLRRPSVRLSPTLTPWRPVLLAGIVCLLGIHAINPVLRGLLRSRFQLPGFSYDFVIADTVPLLAPLVVGIPTGVALAIFLAIGKATGHPMPRWAALGLLFPVAVTLVFTAKFFLEGSIVSTWGQVVHSAGWRMLTETIAWNKDLDEDLFRYRWPALHNFSRPIRPIWHPWGVLLTGLANAVLMTRLIRQSRRGRTLAGRGALAPLTAPTRRPSRAPETDADRTRRR